MSPPDDETAPPPRRRPPERDAATRRSDLRERLPSIDGPRSSDRLPSRDSLPIPDRTWHPDGRPELTVTAVAFWAAVVLPFVSLIALFFVPRTPAGLAVVAALLAANAVALVLGHDYEPGSDGGTAPVDADGSPSGTTGPRSGSE
ncbi:hypothetical protein [Halobaculum sp. EA56]|uniref:hypothetical protein n=1 Tax=Halobaculum sp. EA56 TaxID=3421648 RepID=UPI003EBC7AE3